MKKVSAVIVILMVIGGMSSSSAQPQADFSGGHSLLQNPDVAASFKVLDLWIKATMRNREEPGLSIGIVHDQDLIWSKGYGFADMANKVPAGPSTVYRIASISKLFTTTAILQLRDAGKLQLDDPVARHLSWFRITNLFPEGPTITIRHLLTHTSGLPRDTTGISLNEYTFPTRQDMIQHLPDQETVFPAETEWKYSNLALSLAGEIVSAVSGESWAQYVERNILQPLRMTRTTPLPKPDMSGLAVGYSRRVPGASRSVEPFVDVGAERPAGNIASSVGDLAKFVSLQFRNGKAGGNQILKASTLREMQRVHWLHPDWHSGWGLGFWVRRVGDETHVGHGGRLHGYSVVLEFIAEKKIGVIVLTNADEGNPELYLDRAFEIVGPTIARATEPFKAMPEPDPEWEQYVGAYTWKNSDIEIMILSGKLTMIVPEADNPWESRVILEPVSEHTFRAIPAQLNFHPTTRHGDLLTFELDAVGDVRRFASPSSYWVRK